MGIASAMPGPRPTVAKGTLWWAGKLQPTVLSPVYTVTMEYRVGRRPAIQVVDPVLERRPGKPLPHTYQGDELCLYYPGEWSGKDAIEKTIIPWISEWLLYYEFWLVTGTWLGGE
jgi:hypothetical protein